MSPTTINRLKLLGIALVAVAPVLGSYLLYSFWSPTQHTNYGALLAPRPVPSTRLELVDGKPFDFMQLRGRWVFVVVDSGTCGARCEKKLWLMRQVRQTQGKDVARIERVMLVDDASPPAERLARDYGGTWFVRGRGSGLPEIFPAPQSNRGYIYLVDPQGNVMMRFPEDADPKRMVKDVSRLLRYSSRG